MILACYFFLCKKHANLFSFLTKSLQKLYKSLQSIYLTNSHSYMACFLQGVKAGMILAARGHL